MNNAERLARMFKVLSVDARVRILQFLKDRSLCVNALAQKLNVTPAAVSQHLRVLRDAGAVTSEKRGYFVHYDLNKKTFARWKSAAEALLSVGEQPPAVHSKSRCKRKRI